MCIKLYESEHMGEVLLYTIEHGNCCSCQMAILLLGTSHVMYLNVYHKRGKICWAKLSHVLRFLRVLQKFFCEYSFILYRLRIMVMFKCKAPRRSPSKSFTECNPQKFSPARSFPVYDML